MAEKTHTKQELEKLGRFLQAREGMLFYHGDADGVCSAALFLRSFRGFKYSPRRGPAMGEDFVRMILDKKPGLLVFLDLPVDQEHESLERFLKEIPGLRIVIIDHHIAERDMNSERVLHINPRSRIGDSYMPAACITYRLMEGLGKDVRPLIWIAAMGVIGDYGWEGCPVLIEEASKAYPFLLKGKPQESRLGEGANMIAAATTVKGLSGVGECLKVLLAADGYEDFESSDKLREWNREFDEEFQRMLDDFEENKEVFEKENLVTYEVKSRLNMTSVVSTHIGSKYPDKVIAIRKQERGLWKVSLRNQKGDVSLGDIAKKCSQGIGSGGGHDRAAAAVVSDWEAFLKRMRRFLV